MSTSLASSRPTEQGCDPVRLASYLSIGVTGALMATANSEAAVVAIDLTNVNGKNITAANGGVWANNYLTINNWLGVGTGTLQIYYNSYGCWGLDGSNGLSFAVTAQYDASPRNFGAGETIDASVPEFSSVRNRTAFRRNTIVAPDFGAGSFMGFRFGTAGNFYYGYLEMTWNSSTNTFYFLSGAYESTVNTAIVVPGSAAVPVPAASLLALMALGGNSFRRSRTRAA
jgi:hypothetical protein